MRRQYIEIDNGFKILDGGVQVVFLTYEEIFMLSKYANNRLSRRITSGQTTKEDIENKINEMLWSVAHNPKL